MPSNKAFHRRIQILDQCLRRRQVAWTVSALLEATNGHLAENGCPPVSLRTLYEDLRYLQDTLEAPVEKYQQGKQVCYRYSDAGYTLVNSPLSTEEKALLRKMLDFLRSNNLPMQADIEALLNRHGLLEEAASALAPAKAAGFEPQEYLLNKLVLRIATDDFSAYREVFWKWVESGT